MKKRNLVIVIVVLAVAAASFAFYHHRNKQTSPQPSSTPTTNSSSANTSFSKDQYSVDEASSLWAVVNKGRALPSNYIPENLIVPNVPLRLSAGSSEMHLRSDAVKALETMFAAAKADNINLMLESGYRSYGEQVSVYGGYVKTDGQAKADTYSARPGHSEHQTGLAADIEPTSRQCEVDQCFESTPEGKWLAANSYKYGFVIRYQKNTQNITGYEYEPWHVRYVGTDLAAQTQSSGQTLEQFFGLPTFTDYPSNSFVLKG